MPTSTLPLNLPFARPLTRPLAFVLGGLLLLLPHRGTRADAVGYHRGTRADAVGYHRGTRADAVGYHRGTRADAVGYHRGTRADAVGYLAYVLGGILLLLPTQATWGQNAVRDETAQVADTAKSTETSHSVALTIDFGDGFTITYTALPWREGITVLDAMLIAEKHAHPLVFKHRGAKETAFLMAIHGTENQGGDGRNWIFRVNGKIAKQSFGLTPLVPNDSVSWHYKGHDGGADDTNP